MGPDASCNLAAIQAVHLKGQMGMFIKRRSLLQQLGKSLKRIPLSEQGTVGIMADPAQQSFRIGFEINNKTAFPKQVTVGPVNDNPAAGGDDRALLSLQDCGQNLVFDFPEGRFSLGGKKVGDAAPGALLYLVIRVDKGEAMTDCQQASHAGFSRTHHADKDQVLVLVLEGLHGMKFCRLDDNVAR